MVGTTFSAVLAKWTCAGLRILCPRGTGSIPGVASYLVWDAGQWCDSVSLARVDPALNEYLENLGKVSRKGVRKHKMSGPQPPIALPG
jgi:hypothetical protein